MLECQIRNHCVVSGDKNLEKLSELSYPVYCGCTLEDASNDLIAKEEIVISKEGVIQLKNLIPLEILYKQGHDSGAVGSLWEEHHKEFANFILKSNPKNVLEIGGGHGKLAKHCLEKKPLSWTIVEPNSKNKDENIDYIDGFFHKEIFNHKHFDTIIHSHTFEHIYNPHEFLEDISSAIGGGGDDIFNSQFKKISRKQVG